MDVVVVGSLNYDMFTYCPRFPKPGETISGTRFETGYGGKGCNQAVMAALLRAKVAMVGAVGNDSFGMELIEKSLEANGIEVEHVKRIRDAEVGTGVATILVEQGGENMIVINKGANEFVDKEVVQNASSVIRSAKVLLCQNEICMEGTLQALRIAKEPGQDRGEQTLTIWNPAPASSQFPENAFENVDILCVNETELEMITGKPVADQDKTERIGNVKTLVVTQGSKGVTILQEDHNPEFVPAVKVDNVVDTTGAGDCFIATMAVCLAQGKGLKDSVQRACKISAESIKYRGCQASYKMVDVEMD